MRARRSFFGASDEAVAFEAVDRFGHRAGREAEQSREGCLVHRPVHVEPHQHLRLAERKAGRRHRLFEDAM
jgi:hypothetical protein